MDGIIHFLVTAPEPKTILEALQQRHEELSKRHKQALQDQESAKARRMDRLVKVREKKLIFLDIFDGLWFLYYSFLQLIIRNMKEL